MASSPSDVQGSRNVIQWLERLQQSAQNQPGQGMNARTARTLERRNRRRQLGEPVDALDDSDTDAEDEGGALDGVTADVSLTVETEAGDEGTESGTLRPSDSLPDDAVPIGLLAKLSLSSQAARRVSRERSRAREAGSQSGRSGAEFESENDDENNVGVANGAYFLPGPASDLDVRKALIERHSPPEILVHGLVNAEDVEKLFEMCVSCRL